MFRFFRKENLKSTRRRSASCPNLQQTFSQNINFDGEYLKEKPVDDSLSSNSDTEDSVGKWNKFKAGSQVGRTFNKENNEPSTCNMLCMDDYLSKLPELKLWLKEEQGKKDVDRIKSPKLKSHFKVFMKLWNKQKLPAKYYTDEIYNGMLSSHVLLESSLDDTDTFAPSLPPLPPLLDISINDALDEPGGVHDSPFSTFGKTPEQVENSPAFLAQQVHVSKVTLVRDRSVRTLPARQTSSAQSQAPSKFATILRSTPVASLFKSTSSQPRNIRDISRAALSSPKCPWQLPNSNSEKTLPQTVVNDQHTESPDFQKWVTGWNKFTNQSPIYDTVADNLQANFSEMEPFSQLYSDYSSLSPQKGERSPQKWVAKQPSLNRRRSKSMEDIYSISSKFNSSGGNRRPVNRLNEIETVASQPPPIPDRNYSPVKLLSSSLSFMSQRTESFKSPSSDTVAISTPGTVKADLFHRLVGIQEISPKKRQSEEGVEHSVDSTSPVKKSKPESQLDNKDNSSDLSFASTVINGSFDSTPTLSILTGSLNPTTRSKYKLTEPSKFESSDAKVHRPETLLNPLPLQLLEESPKLPRRKLKRRSSSLSTTPGKGLTFGKSSKLSVASPKRKVSFAKDVKDTETNDPLRRRPGTHHIDPTSQAYFTKQSKEKLEFESFISSHSSPKRNGSPNKITSPINITSLIKKTSPNKIVSPSKVQSTSQNLSNQLPSPMQLVAGLGNLSDIETNPGTAKLQNHTSTNSLVAEDDRLFPSSPTRQLGRRVLGKPTSSLHKFKTSSQADKASEQKKSPEKSIPAKKMSPPKRVDSQLSLMLPRKTINSFVTKLGEKTATICATEMSESEGYSSNEDLLSSAVSDTLHVQDSQLVSKSVIHPLLSEVSNASNKSYSTEQKPRIDFTFQKSSTHRTQPVKRIASFQTVVDESMEQSNLTSSLSDNVNSTSTSHSILRTPSSVSPEPVTNIQNTPHVMSSSVHLMCNSPQPTDHDHLVENKTVAVSFHCTRPTDVTTFEVFKTQNNSDVATHESDINHSGEAISYLTNTNNSQTDAKFEAYQSLQSCAAQQMENDCSQIYADSESKDPFQCQLEKVTSGLARYHSIRASPKIIDDDGWVTERRRSRSKQKSSVSSPNSKHQKSPQEETPNRNDMTLTQTASVSLHNDYTEESLSAQMIQKKMDSYPVNEIIQIDSVSCLHLTGSRSPLKTPQKVKPPVMPKPTVMPKLTSLSSRGVRPSTAMTKRRSSLNKNGLVSVKPTNISAMKSNQMKEDYVQRNINAVAVSRLTNNLPEKLSNISHTPVKKQVNLSENTRRRSKTVQQDSSLTCSESNRRRSKTVQQDLSVTPSTASRQRSKVGVQSVLTSSSTGRRSSKTGSQKVITGLAINRRRSKTDIEEVNGSSNTESMPQDTVRRRSRTSNVFPSFTERKNFFQKFQSSVRHGTQQCSTGTSSTTSGAGKTTSPVKRGAPLTPKLTPVISRMQVVLKSSPALKSKMPEPQQEVRHIPVSKLETEI
uniref:Uncharacterized protein n=1 Tax=Biomphalaria glabrata TaxID=6526 RepID=A0A2C9KSR5_BIOGL